MDPTNPRFLPSVVAIGGGVLVVVGSFLPWITATAPFIGTITRSGLDGGGDGVLALVLGGVLIVFGFAYLSSGKPTQTPIGGVGLVSLVLAGYEWQTVTNRISGLPALAQGLAHVGAGIYAIGAGGLAGIVAAVLIDRVPKTAPPEPPAVPPTPVG